MNKKFDKIVDTPKLKKILKQNTPFEPTLLDDFVQEAIAEENEAFSNLLSDNLTQKKWYEQKMERKKLGKEKYATKGYNSTANHPFLKSAFK